MPVEYLFRWRKFCLCVCRHFFFEEVTVDKMPAGTTFFDEITSFVRKHTFFLIS